jgi:hypothetical protein
MEKEAAKIVFNDIVDKYPDFVDKFKRGHKIPMKNQTLRMPVEEIERAKSLANEITKRQIKPGMSNRQIKDNTKLLSHILLEAVTIGLNKIEEKLNNNE